MKRVSKTALLSLILFSSCIEINAADWLMIQGSEPDTIAPQGVFKTYSSIYHPLLLNSIKDIAYFVLKETNISGEFSLDRIIYLKKSSNLYTMQFICAKIII